MTITIVIAIPIPTTNSIFNHHYRAEGVTRVTTGCRSCRRLRKGTRCDSGSLLFHLSPHAPPVFPQLTFLRLPQLRASLDNPTSSQRRGTATSLSLKTMFWPMKPALARKTQDTSIIPPKKHLNLTVVLY